MTHPKDSSLSLNKKTLFSYLWGLIKENPKRGMLGGAFLSVLLGKIFNAIFPLYFKKSLDCLENTGDFYKAFYFVLGYGFFRLLAFSLGDLRDFIFSPLEQSMIRQLQKKVFDHLMRLPMTFHLNRKTGGLSTAMDRGTRAVEFFFRFFLFNIIPSQFEMWLICGLLWLWYPWIYGVIFASTIICYSAFTIGVSYRRLKQIKEMNEANEGARSRCLDSLLNVATIKSFNGEPLENEVYDQFLGRYEKASLSVRYSLSFLNFGQSFIMTLGMGTILAKTLWDCAQGVLSLNDGVLMNMYLSQFYVPLHILGTAYREVRQAMVDMEKIFGLLELSQEKDNGPAVLSVPKGEIVFSHVSFHYSQNRDILDDISFTIRPYQRVALVGTSGGGKSSLVSLLLRFFSPQQGKILIDGQDIEKCTRQSVRQKIGLVPQDVVLFNGSIRENIAYGALGEASFQAIQEAASQACIHDFIETLPHKYDTLVGERGLKLSGGEKQRLAIARLVLKGAPIWIFDEATSALDMTTEKSIQENIRTLSKGHTTLMVAHRLSSVVDADRIFVLHKGSIVEAGTHQELLNYHGAYARLWRWQNPSGLDAPTIN